MPTKFRDVQEFFERISKLEARVENLMDWQRWQMGILAVLLIAAVKVIVSK